MALVDTASIQADNGAGLRSGIIGLTNKGSRAKPDDLGGAQGLGLGASRALDYLETVPGVDAKHVGIEGVSRCGKAALITMAFDQRFAMVLVGVVGRGRSQAAPPQLRRSGGEPHRDRRLSLDGRQLPEVRRIRGRGSGQRRRATSPSMPMN